MNQGETARRPTETGISRESRARGRRWLAGSFAVGLCALATATSGSMPVAADAEAGLQFAGTLSYGPVTNASGNPHALIDPALHRAYLTPQLMEYARVRVLDLASMRVVKDVPTPAPVDGTGGDANASGAIDLVHHRIFYPPQFNIASTEVCPPGGGAGTGAPQYLIYVLDELSLKWSELPLPCLQDGNPLGLQGMAYDPTTNRLLMDGVDDTVANYVGVNPTSANRTFVRQVNPDTGAVDWEVSVNSVCSQMVDGTAHPEATSKLMRLDHEIAFTCQRYLSPATTENFLGELSLDASGRPQTDAAGLPVLQGVPLMSGEIGFAFDPPSGRLLLYSNDTGNGIGTFIFDVRRNVFAGFIGTGGSTEAFLLRSVGFDPQAGRLYMQSDRGVIVADIRHTPIPAGSLYAPLQLPQKGPAFWEIAVDPATHRVFIPDQASKPLKFVAFDDGIPPTPDNPLPNPDAATKDVAEAPQVTGVNLSGSGNAFGAYYLNAGGVQHVLENEDPLCYVADPFDVSKSPEQALLGQCAAEEGLAHGDRVQFYGHIAELALSNIGAGTITAPIDIMDSATAKDFQQARVYDYNCVTDSQGNEHCQPGARTILEGNGVTWPGDRAACQDFGGKPGGHSVASVGGSASASCDLSRQTVSGDATSNDANLIPAGLPAVAYQAHVTTARDPKQGLVTTATASATGITIPVVPGVSFAIGQISTEAQTAARGRPGTASATFTRHIADFSSPVFSCGSTCDPQQVVDAINQLFSTAGVLAVASLPKPEIANHEMGTPGGYQGLVTKSLATQTSDETVNDDFSDTVAGLEIVYFEDGHSGRSRQILQFAGVHAESHYGIFRLGAEGTTTDLTPPPTDQPLPIASVSLPPSTAGSSHETGQTGGQQHYKNPLQRILSYITDQIADTWRLFVSDPKRAAALAIVWGLLLAPVYLGVRRRSLRQRLEAMA